MCIPSRSLGEPVFCARATLPHTAERPAPPQCGRLLPRQAGITMPSPPLPLPLCLSECIHGCNCRDYSPACLCTCSFRCTYITTHVCMYTYMDVYRRGLCLCINRCIFIHICNTVPIYILYRVAHMCESTNPSIYLSICLSTSPYLYTCVCVPLCVCLSGKVMTRGQASSLVSWYRRAGHMYVWLCHVGE